MPQLTWDHVRKGRMSGHIVGPNRPDVEFVDIRLAEDCRAGYAGEVVTVRRSFLTEVKAG